MTNRAIQAAPSAPFGVATRAGRRHAAGDGASTDADPSGNQDAAFAGPTWFVVADGMGGHRRGDLASTTVVETFATAELDPVDPHTAVTTLCERADTAVRRAAAAAGEPGMGSTLVGLAESPIGVVVFHVGDARCYRLVAGELRLLTRDHSHVQELIDAGRLTTEQARTHPLRNVVTRALGIDGDARPTVSIVDHRPSRFLLCSDGLTAELGPRTIGRVLAGVECPEQAAQRLVELAFEGPALDDTTALVVDTPTIGENDRGAGPHEAAAR
ncbi:MAG: protein phosphatase [Acidimicrobiaceae bacterium]|nr:protein phosphatase [Acidimicrobiaceae bacterium]